MKRAFGADLIVQGAGEVYGGVGEVDAGCLRSETRPRHGVHPEVTLEVEERLAGYVADLTALNVGERYLAPLESFHVVEGGCRVYGGAFVPVGAVGLQVVYP